MSRINGSRGKKSAPACSLPASKFPAVDRLLSVTSEGQFIGHPCHFGQSLNLFHHGPFFDSAQQRDDKQVISQPRFTSDGDGTKLLVVKQLWIYQLRSNNDQSRFHNIR
jgi:hypothetical protein